MKRLCPPPSTWRSLRAGDRVRFQSEDMPVEIEDTIARCLNGRLVTVGGREILPDDYVFRLAAPEQALVVPPELPGLDRLRDQLASAGPAAVAELAPRSRELAVRLSARLRDLVQDIHETRRRLARPAN